MKRELIITEKSPKKFIITFETITVLYERKQEFLFVIIKAKRGVV